MFLPPMGKKRRDALATNYKSVPVVVRLWAQSKNPREMSLSCCPQRLIHGCSMKVFNCWMDVGWGSYLLDECWMPLFF